MRMHKKASSQELNQHIRVLNKYIRDFNDDIQELDYDIQDLNDDIKGLDKKVAETLIHFCDEVTGQLHWTLLTNKLTLKETKLTSKILRGGVKGLNKGVGCIRPRHWFTSG